MREARPITTQNPSVGLYRFATAFPGHRKHVALQRQSFASAWPVAILHLEGFKTCAKHGPSRHKTPGHVAILHIEGFKRARSTAHHDTKPLCGPLPLCHCLPRSPQTRCPAAAVLCQRLASRHTPFRGFQNVREARPITTQNPSVGLYRFATAFPGHRELVALQRQPFASAWPCRHTPFDNHGPPNGGRRHQGVSPFIIFLSCMPTKNIMSPIETKKEVGKCLFFQNLKNHRLQVFGIVSPGDVKN